MNPTTRTPPPEKKLIHDLRDIPEFQNEEEERAFWDDHAFSEELLDKVSAIDHPEVNLPPRRPAPSVSVSVRIERDTIQRLKVLAQKKHLRYQTLLKTFLTERLYEEERREGLVPSSQEEAHDRSQ